MRQEEQDGVDCDLPDRRGELPARLSQLGASGGVAGLGKVDQMLKRRDKRASDEQAGSEQRQIGRPSDRRELGGHEGSNSRPNGDDQSLWREQARDLVPDAFLEVRPVVGFDQSVDFRHVRHCPVLIRHVASWRHGRSVLSLRAAFSRVERFSWAPVSSGVLSR